MLAIDDGELVDREPVIVRGILVVEHGNLGSAQSTTGGSVLDRHAVHQHSVKCAVACF